MIWQKGASGDAWGENPGNGQVIDPAKDGNVPVDVMLTALFHLG